MAEVECYLVVTQIMTTVMMALNIWAVTGVLDFTWRRERNLDMCDVYLETSGELYNPATSECDPLGRLQSRTCHRPENVQCWLRTEREKPTVTTTWRTCPLLICIFRPVRPDYVSPSYLLIYSQSLWPAILKFSSPQCWGHRGRRN